MNINMADPFEEICSFFLRFTGLRWIIPNSYCILSGTFRFFGLKRYPWLDLWPFPPYSKEENRSVRISKKDDRIVVEAIGKI